MLYILQQKTPTGWADLERFTDRDDHLPQHRHARGREGGSGGQYQTKSAHRERFLGQAFKRRVWTKLIID